MSEMVDRVARALSEGEWDAKDFSETLNGEEPEEARDYWRDKARIAIAAMREPTDEMRLSCGNGECAKWAPGAWINYIEAALT